MRKRKHHFLHKLKGKNFNLNIIDICNNDSRSLQITESIILYIKNSEKESIYKELFQEIPTKINVIFNIPSITPLETLQKSASLLTDIQDTQSTRTNSSFCSKENNNLLFLLNKYKKEVNILKQQINVYQQANVSIANKVKVKEKELAKEIMVLQKYTNDLKNIIRNDQSKEVHSKSVLGFVNNSLYASPLTLKGPSFSNQAIKKPSRIARPKSLSVTNKEYENIYPRELSIYK